MAVIAAANALVSLADVKYEWGRAQTDTGDDDRAQTLINNISAVIELYCGRTFASTIYTDELIDGTSSKYLQLKHWPVIAFSTLKEDDATVDAANYKIYYAEGLIYTDGTWTVGAQNYKATYTAGYAVLPAAIKQACIEWVIILLEGRFKDADITGKDSHDIPGNVKLKLDMYRNLDITA